MAGEPPLPPTCVGPQPCQSTPVSLGPVCLTGTYTGVRQRPGGGQGTGSPALLSQLPWMGARRQLGPRLITW